MDIFTPVRDRIKRLPDGALKRLAQNAGVSHGTLVKIKYGQTTDPRVRTVEKLYVALLADERPATSDVRPSAQL